MRLLTALVAVASVDWRAAMNGPKSDLWDYVAPPSTLTVALVVVTYVLGLGARLHARRAHWRSAHRFWCEHVATPVDALTWSEVVVRLSSMQARRDPVLVANQSLLPGLRSEMLPGLRVALRDSQSVMFLKIEGRIINVNFSKLPD